MVVGNLTKRIEMENTSLLVFLYDETSKDEIIKKRPQTLFDMKPYSIIDPEFFKLAAEGIMATLELKEAKKIDIHFEVGETFRADKKIKKFFIKPQKTLVKIPSGSLVISTIDNLFQDLKNDSLHRGELIKVPPGDYILSLYRKKYLIDFDVDEEPYLYILLTPLKENENFIKRASVLRYVPNSNLWNKKYKIEDEIFYGKVIVAPEAIWVNMDKKAAENLKLQRGMGIVLETAGETHLAVYLNRVDLFNDWYKPLYSNDEISKMMGPEGKTLCASWGTPIKGKRIKALRFIRFDWELGNYVSKKAFKGAEVKIIPLKDKFHETPSLESVGCWSVKSKVVEGSILAINGEGMILNVEPEPFKNLKVRSGTKIYLEVNKQRRKLIYCPNENSYFRRISKYPNENISLIRKLKKELKEKKYTKDILWIEYLDMGKRAKDSLGFSLIESRFNSLREEVEKIENQIKKLMIPNIKSEPPLLGMFIPHWDIDCKKVLSCRTLYKGMKIGIKAFIGDKVKIEVL